MRCGAFGSTTDPTSCCACLDVVANPFGAAAEARSPMGMLTRANAMLAKIKRYRPGEPLMLMGR